ncbi:hypothetical protein BGZ57DRAFT_350189 [Hyaloscypha finlandica]|nr:hypothetical protein BGZ57DRAFT_350189 [Hyaloscypha finlandica]
MCIRRIRKHISRTCTSALYGEFACPLYNTALAPRLRLQTIEPSLLMPSRASHLTSRRGCQQCKKRRIKCDETHPICPGCTKHGISCSFNTPPPQTPKLPNSRSGIIIPTIRPETSPSIHIGNIHVPHRQCQHP